MNGYKKGMEDKTNDLEPIVELIDVSADFGVFHLKKLSLKIYPNEYHILLGPTGAGKTLILELIAGFHQKYKGSIKIFGKKMEKVPPYRRQIGFVYQNYALFPHMNIFENIAFGLRIKQIDEEETNKKVNGIMRDLKIEHLKERYPYTLSGGEQQKSALARALIVKPKILLLDEPFSALDPVSRKAAMHWIKKLHKEYGLTTIQVTHDQDEALVGDRISIIMNGEIVDTGSVEDIMNAPKDERLATFVGIENIIPGKIITNENGYATVKTEHFEVKCLSKFKSGSVTIFIRPENIVISKEPLKSSLRNMIKSKIKEIYLISKELCQIVLENKLNVYITRNAKEMLGLKEGLVVYASFKATAISLKRN